MKFFKKKSVSGRYSISAVLLEGRKRDNGHLNVFSASGRDEKTVHIELEAPCCDFFGEPARFVFSTVFSGTDTLEEHIKGWAREFSEDAFTPQERYVFLFDLGFLDVVDERYSDKSHGSFALMYRWGTKIEPVLNGNEVAEFKTLKEARDYGAALREQHQRNVEAMYGGCLPEPDPSSVECNLGRFWSAFRSTDVRKLKKFFVVSRIGRDRSCPTDSKELVSHDGDKHCNRLEKTFDANGKMTSQTCFYDVEPFCGVLGKIVYTFNEKELAVKAEYFDQAGNRCLCNDNIAGWTSEYDADGHEIRRDYFGVDGKTSVPLGGSKPFNSWEKTFDANGKITSKTWFYDIKPYYGVLGKVVFTYNEKELAVKGEFFDQAGNRCLCNEKIAGWTSEYDADGHVIRRDHFGVDGKTSVPFGGDDSFNS